MIRPIRIFCIDDNKLLAETLAHRIGYEEPFEWAGWVHNATEAQEAVRAARPDVIMLDVDMPGHDSFELARDLARLQPNVKVVMFSGHIRVDYIDRAVDAGAWGYLSKNDSMEDILAAIRRVAEGEFALTPDVDMEYWRKA